MVRRNKALVAIIFVTSSSTWTIPRAACFHPPPAVRRHHPHPASAPKEQRKLLRQSCAALHERKDWTTTLFPVLPSSWSPTTTTTRTTTIVNQVVAPSDRRFASQACIQTLAGCIGALTGFFIAAFKLSIESIREFAYGDFTSEFPPILIPLVGGAACSALALLGGGTFPPGVRGIVREADRDSLNINEKSKIEELLESFRKASAAVFTLGTGISLGPEGPGVEIGIAASRLGVLAWPKRYDTVSDNNEILNDSARVRRNRLFLACCAAAGVSSGFNAPLAGVFFALEVIQKILPAIDIPAPAEMTMMTKRDEEEGPYSTVFEMQQESLSTEAGSITAILTSSVVAALVTRTLLGNELALRLLEYEIPTPLRELPLYLLLGATSGFTAVVFSQTAKIAKATFDGEAGPQYLRDAFDATPGFVKPMVGGLTCGIVGYYFPNILFFGYETLNGLLLNYQIETEVAFSLLVAKIFATAVSAASGLVGGTLAPTLFMGGMVGVTFHNILVNAVDVSTLDLATSAFGSSFEIAQLPAYTMVGAASFLAAVFRAPLTASLLAFELTRNYDVLIPLLASAGVGTLLCDLVESRIDKSDSSK